MPKIKTRVTFDKAAAAQRIRAAGKISFTSALARMEWAKYAKDIYADDWRRVYENALKGAMQ